MQTIRFSAALAASLALLVGISSTAYGQVGGNPGPGVGGPGLGAPPVAGQAQPGNYSQPQAGLPQSAPPTAGATVPSGRGVNGIGVIDVKFLFTKYEKFEQQMQTMRTRVEAAEAEVKKEQDAMKQMGEKLRLLDPTSAQYKQLEQDALRRQSELQIRVATQKRQFGEDEGRIFYNTAKEIDDAVKMVASRFSLNIVFRVNIDEPNPNNRQEIMMGLSKSIFYYHPQMDITPFVLDELRRGGLTARGNGAAPNPNSMRPQPQRQ